MTLTIIQTESDLTLGGEQQRHDDEHLCEILKLHLHPEHGSLFWLQREAELGLSILDRVRSINDLASLGTMNADILSARSVWDFVPRGESRHRSHFITAETGGTTGVPIATVYSRDDFEEAFIKPFVKVAKSIGFPTCGEWLFIGPSGPHIIGKAQRRLAEEMGAPDPWSVDFDPRWVKRLVPESFGAQRYIEHVLSQAKAILSRESVTTLFSTPPILSSLAADMDDTHREQILSIHYCGMTISAEQVNHFRALFPNAVHLSGYGNTLFGCALEVSDIQREHVDYYPNGNRLHFGILPNKSSKTDKPNGQIYFHRLDRSMLLVGFCERDWASVVAPNAAALQLGIARCGLRDPGPCPETKQHLRVGIY